VLAGCPRRAHQSSCGCVRLLQSFWCCCGTSRRKGACSTPWPRCAMRCVRSGARPERGCSSSATSSTDPQQPVACLRLLRLGTSANDQVRGRAVFGLLGYTHWRLPSPCSGPAPSAARWDLTDAQRLHSESGAGAATLHYVRAICEVSDAADWHSSWLPTHVATDGHPAAPSEAGRRRQGETSSTCCIGSSVSIAAMPLQTEHKTTESTEAPKFASLDALVQAIRSHAPCPVVLPASHVAVLFAGPRISTRCSAGGDQGSAESSRADLVCACAH
jgi:hypothetical protein